MNARQENILSMYHGLVRYVNADLEAAAEVPFFMETFGQFITAYEGIQHYRAIQETVPPGSTLDRSALRNQLESATLGLSAQLMALAGVKKNYSLSKRASYAGPELAKVTDMVMKDIAELIFRLAQEFLQELSIYEVSPAQLAAFKELIAQYGTSLSKPRQSINDKTNASEQIEQMFDVAKEKMDLMDKLVENAKGKYGDFYKGYVRVTHMTNLGNQHLSLRAIAKDVMGNPIENVSFEILANSEIKARGEEGTKVVAYLHKRTSDKGNVHIQNLPEGSYTALVKKSGFQDKEVIFQLLGGGMVDLEVTMEPA